VFSISGTPRVLVNSRSPGAIQIFGSDNNSVEVDVALREESYLDWNVAQTGDSIAVSCQPRAGAFVFPGGLSLEGARADFSVKVPRQAVLDLRNRFGEIKVIGVKGSSINAESSVGSIAISDFEGTTQVTTRTGLLSLENVKGKISARNQAGSINYSGNPFFGDSSFNTKVGNIDITLAGDLNLKIDASSKVGVVSIDPSVNGTQDQSEQYGIGSRIHYTVGSGACRLFLETITGTISIHKSPLQR
jgi:hypothetical protein